LFFFTYKWLPAMSIKYEKHILWCIGPTLVNTVLCMTPYSDYILYIIHNNKVYIVDTILNTLHTTPFDVLRNHFLFFFYRRKAPLLHFNQLPFYNPGTRALYLPPFWCFVRIYRVNHQACSPSIFAFNNAEFFEIWFLQFLNI